MRFALAGITLLFALLPSASASTILLGGSITQSTADGTGPAVANPSLNNILDLEPYTITLDTAQSITAPGLYTLTGSSLVFAVPSAPAMESDFGTVTLSVAANGSFLDFNLLACLSGADCTIGNFLSASFEIPASSVGQLGVTATGLDQPHPLDLLEDDGTTDIQGSVTTYSNTAPASAVTPEPSSGSLVALSLFCVAALAVFRLFRPKTL